ncbi:MAG: hypothetical protein KF891_24675 [Rhizobacter sp.]|nr:hypothetical protein [Rhizobacter sp.]
MQAATGLLLAATLVAAISGGLLRAGLALPGAGFVIDAVTGHGALMVCGFLGTVIGIERAVALKRRWAYVTPACTLAGSVLLLAGQHAAAAGLYALASTVFVLVNLLLVHRQGAAHTRLLLVAAIAWLIGNLLLAAGHGGDGVHAWWFAFLVVTIAAERLEMTRLMQRHPSAQLGLVLILGLLLAGAALAGVRLREGGLVFGLALAALAAWLGHFDVARRTALSHGLSRYMAVCLLSGYVWLGLAGLAWAAMGWRPALRDIALHALGLGFIVGMVMGHAPAILPAVARVKLHYGPWFYAPLALLQLSLLLRLGAGYANPAWRSAGAALNALALALFVATLVGSALAWRKRHGPRGRFSNRPAHRTP